MPQEILGTIYTNCSDNFMRGIYQIARTVMSEKNDLAVVTVVRGADVEVKQIGNLTENAKRDNPNRRRVYDGNGLSPTLTSGMGEGGNLQPFTIVAMRGRNPENPSDRKAGSPAEQRLKPNSRGICNALTSAQKDNMALANEEVYRIRKLTPLECWRLMDFSDEDFHKAAEVNSNSRLYKQAGNSICRSVLIAILGQMIPRKDEKTERDKSMMMGMDDTIEFFMEISQILDDNDVETSKDFPDKYTHAMNRLRYERDKSCGAAVKQIKSKNRRGCIVKCGNCGSECIDGNPHYKYCPNCGYAVKGYQMW